MDLRLREFHSFEAAGSSFCIWCRAPRCLRSTTAPPRCARRAGARRRATRSHSSASWRRVSTPTKCADTIAELRRVRAIGDSGAAGADAEDPAAQAGAAADAGRQRHQPVQPGLHLLLRVRRRQDRRYRERQAAEVHERGNGARERRLHAARIARQPDRAHDVLRRRDADELSRC